MSKWKIQMSDRFFASSGTLAVGVELCSLASFAVACQAQTTAPVAKHASATKTWSPRLTVDGQPDLQGVWLSNSATPLERPKALEGRQFLTDDEVTELKQRAARLFNGSDADFPGGDTFFLAVLANPDRFKNPNATGGTEAMIEREFDNR